MLSNLFRHAGRRAAHKVVSRHSRPGGFLDFRYGFDLLRDPTVPAGVKLLAFALGFGLMGLLMTLEIPLEGILGLLLPLAGLVTDALVDGLEMVVLPFLFACLILPHLRIRST